MSVPVRGSLPHPRRLPRPPAHTRALSICCCALAVVAPPGAPPYRNRVAAVLEYISAHPMQLTGIPMEYDRHPAAALPDVVQGLTTEDVAQGAGSASDMARVVLALLYLACGGVDQAHNLVTPLCWGSFTAYGGPPVRGSPAARDAAYVHALIHRQEGPLDGEFGSGFSNANFWFGLTGRHALFPAVLEAARRATSGDAALEHALSYHGDEWDPYKFVSLCVRSTEGRDAAQVRFCEAVINAEWRLLFQHCYTALAANE